MQNPHVKEAVFSSPHGDKHFSQGGQFIDMNFMAASNTCSNSSAGASRRPWQRSLDSQEFGFASNLMDSTEVAPADELFFKGQLLPLQVDHRRHLVQALSSSSEQISPTIARVGSSRLVDDLCQDDEVIEFNSCRLESEVSQLELSMHDYRLPNHAIIPLPAHCMQISKESSCYITGDEKLKLFPSNIKGCVELDWRAGVQNQIADRNREHGILSLYEDEELHSCSSIMGALDSKIASTTDSLTDPGSSSFRSQNSGFWDSGTDKDMMDSSSSRDSNGSSQDSYFHSNHHVSGGSSHHHPHNKLINFNVSWKSALFKRGSCRKQGVPQNSIKVGFSEDLGKYKACVAPSLNEVKEALLPWKLEREANAHGSKTKKRGKNERRLYSSACNDGCSANVMAPCKSSTHVVCDAGAKKILVQDGSTSKSFRVPTKGADAGTVMDEEMKTQRSAAVKERWQMYMRRLKPLYEMKRGLMEQFRMDECGKRAYCEVEHGTIHSTRQANGEVQRRLCHQPSSASCNVSKNHKLGTSARTQQQKQANGYSHKVLAMSSCPSSTISSPSHSGVLAVLDPNQKISAPKPATICGKASSKASNHARPCSSSSTSVGGASIVTNSSKSSGSAPAHGGNNYRSVSTMHELHSALQSAIAHCKESNKKLNHAAN